jgi:hypothetical protein
LRALGGAGLVHPQRYGYRHSGIWFGSPRKGKRGGAFADAHAAGTSDTGCSFPDAISRHVAVPARSRQAMDAKFLLAMAMISGPPTRVEGRRIGIHSLELF